MEAEISAAKACGYTRMCNSDEKCAGKIRNGWFSKRSTWLNFGAISFLGAWVAASMRELGIDLPHLWELSPECSPNAVIVGRNLR